MKTLAERERELIALEEQRRREQAAVTDREKACAAELVQNVNQYLEEKGSGM